MNPPPEKICPACAAHAPIQAPTCQQCGHVFRTKFAPPLEQTQMYQPGINPPGVTPPQGLIPALPPVYPPPTQPPPIIIYNAPQTMPAGTVQLAPGTHSVALAIVLAFFIVGTGQMVNKQPAKGVVTMLTAILVGVPTWGIGWAIVSIASFIDAICIANRLNRGEPVGPWQWF